MLQLDPRRQASEIAIHRFDAEHARGIESHFEPEFAADMLDELLSGFAPRPGLEALDISTERVLHVHANDVDEHWYLTIGRDGITTARTGDHVDLTASGTAAELYLLFWNRAEDSSVSMDGEKDLMDLWRQICQVRWSGGE